MKPVRHEEDIDALLRSAKALAVLTAWNELGLFQALADGPKTIAQLPADARALETTIPVLKHLGLLHGQGDELALSAVAQRLLEARHLPSARNLEFLRDQGEIVELMRRGGPISQAQSTDGGVRPDDREHNARFLDMLYRRSRDSAQVTFEWTRSSMPSGGSMLDLGGGHGRYARTFADAGYRATLFDFPHVIEYAREKHGDVLQYRAGDFRDPELRFGGPYDLILLSNIVHGEPDAQNRRLVARLARELSPGGHLVLKDMFVDEHGQNPENAVFFGLTMLFYTQAGQVFSVERASGWLEEVGLEVAPMAMLGSYQLICGRRVS